MGRTARGGSERAPSDLVLPRPPPHARGTGIRVLSVRLNDRASSTGAGDGYAL
ncbi:hypothetical protein B005_0806 [Nocardiopsis alba ATCC BAA-2165]|uniref:Uncharacterized protein n=1 Tax=Nocardiopsis alba (strain ATCC BAA-2165 / BE74) TaxID=1205910 RepID=J7LHL1_NOCAA|nr:hypothetical protein B005_0806 [Nocardiopsis alba ATCC BAA-2165]